jgi:hypothetical protein
MSTNLIKNLHETIEDSLNEIFDNLTPEFLEKLYGGNNSTLRLGSFMDLYFTIYYEKNLDEVDQYFQCLQVTLTHNQEKNIILRDKFIQEIFKSDISKEWFLKDVKNALKTYLQDNLF